MFAGSQNLHENILKLSHAESHAILINARAHMLFLSLPFDPFRCLESFHDIFLNTLNVLYILRGLYHLLLA